MWPSTKSCDCVAMYQIMTGRIDLYCSRIPPRQFSERDARTNYSNNPNLCPIARHVRHQDGDTDGSPRGHGSYHRPDHYDGRVYRTPIKVDIDHGGSRGIYPDHPGYLPPLPPCELKKNQD
eukprot:sb/3476036/